MRDWWLELDKKRKELIEEKEKKGGKSKHKEKITEVWSETTFLGTKQGRSMVVLGGFEFYQDDVDEETGVISKGAISELKINMAHIKGRMMNSAEDILKAEAFEDIAKEKVKENKFKNIFK